jgi:hypothetical protein
MKFLLLIHSGIHAGKCVQPGKTKTEKQENADLSLRRWSRSLLDWLLEDDDLELLELPEWELLESLPLLLLLELPEDDDRDRLLDPDLKQKQKSKCLQTTQQPTHTKHHSFPSAPTGAWGDGKGSPSGSVCSCPGGRVEGQSPAFQVLLHCSSPRFFRFASGSFPLRCLT